VVSDVYSLLGANTTTNRLLGRKVDGRGCQSQFRLRGVSGTLIMIKLPVLNVDSLIHENCVVL
jgi:hypothetical protein